MQQNEKKNYKIQKPFLNLWLVYSALHQNFQKHKGISHLLIYIEYVYCLMSSKNFIKYDRLGFLDYRNLILIFSYSWESSLKKYKKEPLNCETYHMKKDWAWSSGLVFIIVNIHGNMIEVYKYAPSFYFVNPNLLPINQGRISRGHELRLLKISKTTNRQNCFTNKVVDSWNKLSLTVVKVPSLNS